MLQRKTGAVGYIAVAEKTERQTAGQEISRRIRQAGHKCKRTGGRPPGSHLLLDAVYRILSSLWDGYQHGEAWIHMEGIFDYDDEFNRTCRIRFHFKTFSSWRNFLRPVSEPEPNKPDYKPPDKELGQGIETGTKG
jgi:hypothetical protein